MATVAAAAVTINGDINGSGTSINKDDNNNNVNDNICAMGCTRWCSLQRRLWHQRVIAFAGDDVNIWSLSYHEHAGGTLRNDDFERHYAYRMLKPSMGIAIVWSIIGLLFIASDWDHLDHDTFRLALILRIAGVINLICTTYWFRITSIAAIASNGAVNVSLYRLRFVAIVALFTPAVWTEAVRIITRPSIYLSPSGLPLVFLGEAACAPLLFRHFVPIFITFGALETVNEMYWYGITEDTGLGAWFKVMVVIQCSIIAYLREVSERRLFGLALPVMTTTRWHKHDHVHDITAQQLSLKDLPVPDMVFSESFSQLPDTPPRSFAHFGARTSPVIDQRALLLAHLQSNHVRQSVTSSHNLSSPLLHASSSSSVTSSHHSDAGASITSSSSSPSSVSSSSSTGMPSWLRVINPSFELWYDDHQMASYRIALILITLSIALFAIADYTMLYHDEYIWFRDALLTRFAFMIPVMIITLSLTFMTCNNGRNRYQTYICICAIITGIGAIGHYIRHVPLTSIGDWAPQSNAYLNALLRYLMVICSSFRLRFAYAITAVITIFITTVIITYVTTHIVPLDFILFGVAYVGSGVWLAHWSDRRSRLLHAALLAKYNVANDVITSANITHNTMTPSLSLSLSSLYGSTLPTNIAITDGIISASPDSLPSAHVMSSRARSQQSTIT